MKAVQFLYFKSAFARQNPTKTSPFLKGKRIGLLTLVMLCTTWLQAQDPSSSNLEQLWRDYNLAIQSEDQSNANLVFEAMRREKARVGAEIFEPASDLFIQAGKQALQAGDTRAAQREFLNAEELTPYSWAAFAGLATVKRQEGDFLSYLHLHWKGFWSAIDVENTFFSLSVFIWFLENLVLLIKGLIILFAVGFLILYFMPLSVTNEALFKSKSIEETFARVLGALLTLLPLLLGFNVLLCAVAFLLMLFPFLTDLQRKVTTVALLILALVVPPLLLLISAATQLRGNPVFRVKQMQYFDGNIELHKNRIEEMEAQGLGDDETTLIKAMLQKAANDMDAAMETLNSIDESSPLWPQALLNHGNISYLQQDYNRAITTYREVSRLRPDMVNAIYNLSLAEAAKGNQSEAEALRAQARNMDPDFLSGNLPSAPDGSPLPLAGTLPKNNSLFGLVFENSDGIWQKWLTRSDILAVTLTALVALFLGWLQVRIRNDFNLAMSCLKCGMVYFQSESPNSKWCSQCIHLYKKGGDLPETVRTRKNQMVRRFEKRRLWQYRIMHLLAPGLPNIMKGSAFMGMIILFFWVVFWVFAAFPPTRLADSGITPSVGGELWATIPMIAAGLWWLGFGVFQAWREA